MILECGASLRADHGRRAGCLTGRGDPRISARSRAPGQMESGPVLRHALAQAQQRVLLPRLFIDSTLTIVALMRAEASREPRDRAMRAHQRTVHAQCPVRQRGRHTTCASVTTASRQRLVDGIGELLDGLGPLRAVGFLERGDGLVVAGLLRLPRRTLRPSVNDESHRIDLRDGALADQGHQGHQGHQGSRQRGRRSRGGPQTRRVAQARWRSVNARHLVASLAPKPASNAATSSNATQGALQAPASGEGAVHGGWHGERRTAMRKTTVAAARAGAAVTAGRRLTRGAAAVR